MSHLPKVSVIIPSYNRARQLKATLSSVFAQTLPPFEVFLVDDGSTDDTAEVLTAFKREFADWGHRLRNIHQENQGKSVALNRGLQDAGGDWIAFNDSDDLWHKEKLSLQFDALRQFPDCGGCFSDADL